MAITLAPRYATPAYWREWREEGRSGERAAWVLVASGDADRRMTLFRLLERGGLRATVVHDGRDALAMLQEEPFDAVVLDVLDGEATPRPSSHGSGLTPVRSTCPSS